MVEVSKSLPLDHAICMVRSFLARIARRTHCEGQQPCSLMSSRRPDGALEDALMRVLWSAEGPLLPATIRGLLSMDLAYTSVTTVLVRLLEKGLVQRQAVGNAYRYSAKVDEATLIAHRMSAVLDQSSNHRNALAGFVSQLGQRDALMLKALLDEQGA